MSSSSNNHDNHDNILHFCQFTDADPEKAAKYLQICDNNLDSAVQFYFENNGADLPDESSAAAVPPIQSQTQNHHVTTSTTTDSLPASPAQFESFYEPPDLGIYGQHLTHHTPSSDAHTPSSASYDPSSEYRAPIAPRREILSGGYDIFADEDNMTMGTTHMTTSTLHSETRGRPNIFRQDNLDPFRNIADETEVLEGNSTSQQDRLAELFRPPFDIMARGDFDTVRTMAKQSFKWMLVNVQDSSEFVCQTLNRDLWRDKKVKEFVKEHFVFMQIGHESPDGKRYKSFYPFQSFPHYAIIDPRTGERVKSFETVLSPNEFVDTATLFLNTHSLTSTSLPTVQSSSLDASSLLPQPSFSSVKKKSISEMTEDEQLEAALAASLAESEAERKKEQADKQRERLNQPSRKGKEVVVIDDDEEEDKGDDISKIKPILHPEPNPGPDVTRIQFRLPDGSRQVRRFSKSDSVRKLFEYVKAVVDEAKAQPFELKYHTTDLKTSLGKSIQEAGLENVSLTMSFL